MPAPRLALTRTYLAPAAGTAPGGGELPGVADVGTDTTVHTEETHYDTPDLALAAAGVSVRRQTGDGPRGWVLELPGRGPRHHEVRQALGRAVRTAPAALQRLTWAAARGRTLGPVLQLTADARQRDLLDADGLVVARLTTRTVVARPLTPPDSAAQEWAEWQAEVVDGRRDLLDAVAAAWEELGAEESDRTHQVRTVLDDPDEGDDAGQAPGAAGGAGALVLGQLADDVTRLLVQDPLVRIDAPDAVHAMHVATRRLGNVLATSAELFEEAPREHLRAELAWLTSVLAAARDVEVLTDRMLPDLDEEAAGQVAGSGTGDPAVVAEHVRGVLARRHDEAQAAVVAALDTERYRGLVEALEAFVAVPSFAAGARRSVRKALLPLVADAHKQVKEAYRDLDPDGETEDALDRLQRAAARARDAAELLEPARGDAAADYADAVKELLDVLAEHHESVLARALLEELVPTAGAGAFVLGRLHGLEEVRAAVAAHDLEDAWSAASSKKLRRWMR
ncbi:CYTH and CHAD domain-containing protein [Kineococcus rubinsiae]|uniref:CYTH and CHAD domain-containing protein n=1 Tax=Kineococcus rubinsiae TaxID=2609562 RepID=UPI001430ABEC|nr:CYTH and CHAD domain-containing protein [Kineococcus rubinsiae]NIZ93377.1 CYTH and CHAD domain-containing protein [Kineococcus rubinsiae]